MGFLPRHGLERYASCGLATTSPRTDQSEVSTLAHAALAPSCAEGRAATSQLYVRCRRDRDRLFDYGVPSHLSLRMLGNSHRYLTPRVPVVQWPRTPPFHGGNTGSNPVGDAICLSDSVILHAVRHGVWLATEALMLDSGNAHPAARELDMVESRVDMATSHKPTQRRGKQVIYRSTDPDEWKRRNAVCRVPPLCRGLWPLSFSAHCGRGLVLRRAQAVCNALLVPIACACQMYTPTANAKDKVSIFSFVRKTQSSMQRREPLHAAVTSRCFA